MTMRGRVTMSSSSDNLCNVCAWGINRGSEVVISDRGRTASASPSVEGTVGRIQEDE